MKRERDTSHTTASLEDGEAVRLQSFSNNVLAFCGPKAFPPGAPVHLRWNSHALQGRSIGSKRRDDASFNVRIRMVSLTRTQREQLMHGAEQW